MSIEEFSMLKRLLQNLPPTPPTPPTPTRRDDDDDRQRDNQAPASIVVAPPDDFGFQGLGSRTEVEEEWEGLSQWGGVNYNVTYPEEPEELQLAHSLSPTDQITLWDAMANTPMDGGGGGGGGSSTLPPILPPSTSETGYQPPEVKWETGTYEAAGENVPDWWRPMVPQSSDDYNRPDAVFTMMMNAMIPHLSPEDQVTVGRQLYTMWGNDFSMYKDLDVDAQISPEQAALGLEGNVADVNYFRSPQRAQEAVSTLSNLRESTVEGNRWKFGPGYKFLQELMEAFGNVGKTTRANTVQTLGQLDPLLSSTQSGELAPFAPIANMLTNPFFSRFQLTPTSRTETGEYVFGKPSKQLYF